MSERTIVINEDGEQLAMYPTLMKQALVGNDFYVGQERYVIVSIEASRFDETNPQQRQEEVITVKKP